MITNKLFLLTYTEVCNLKLFFITILFLFDLTNSTDCTELSNFSFILCSSNLGIVLYKEPNNLPVLYNLPSGSKYLIFKELLNKAQESANSKSEDTNNNDEDKLDPNYITGITDGEGNFYISINKRQNNKEQIRFYYKVTQRDYSKKLLNQLEKFFNCGTVIVDNKKTKTFKFQISNLKDIELKVIPHFSKYPLLSSKKLNFNDFKKAFTLFKNRAHKTAAGLDEIKKLKTGMNKGRSFEDKFNSLNSKDIKIHPAWIPGFVDGEGSFNPELGLKLITENKLGVIIKTNLSIKQNLHDIALLDAIKSFFNNNGMLTPKLSDITNLEIVKSKAYKKKNVVGLVKYVNSNLNSFIPLLYAISSEKQKDFIDFKKFCALKKAKAHLTRTGLEEMIKIAWGMNSGRFGKSKRKELIKPDWNKITKIVTV